MKILKAKIDWHFGYGNDPSLRVLVDRIPEKAGLIYERRDGLYMAVMDGYVSFYAWKGPGNDGGFYGSEFPIMTTAGPVILKGPWSSRAGVMNMHFEQQVVDAGITDKPRYFDEDQFYGGAITLELAREAIAMIPDVTLEKLVDNRDGDITYQPSYKGLSPEGKAQKPKIHKHECPICKMVFDEDICPRCRTPIR